eukprot:jgi/Chlat1/7532/Chrsp62S07029
MKRAHAETVAGDGAAQLEVAAEVNGGEAKRLQVDDQGGALEQQVAPVSEGAKTCLHQTSYPEGYLAAVDKPIPLKPAKTYPFTLDPFQSTAISCLEKGESVLVSAHTSAGKTVVAEYAIAMSLRDNQRCVYTSPIKALSNQKYRELYEEFSDVGLMTGDVTINPNASVLVMTTEILRSMLYRGSEVIREVAWIIFDEVHYMRDKERGVVWEESILLVPDNARLVFLSATVPNAKEFADWCAKIHRQPCHIVYTDFRPTPLQHYIFPAGGDGIFLVVDEKSKFREDNFQKAVDMLSAASQADADKKSKKDKSTSGPSDVYKLVRMVMAKNYDPCIIFSFSKRECEALALQMAKLDLNDDEEKKLVEGIYNNAIDSLSDDDKRLPQVTAMLPLLRRGIGMHHSGLLPIIKEVIEILFQEGLLKALFATETFSIGLNMPAKTVVFTSVRKFDGEGFRWVSSGEYIQMSGRAGRRGLDDRGVVILMVDERMEPSVAKGMLKGRADTLDSSMRLSYSTLLNMLRVEDASPESLLQKSYKQFQADKSLPDLRRKVEDLEAQRAAIEIEDEAELEEFYSLRRQLTELRAEMRQQVFAADKALPFLQPGRLARILFTHDDAEAPNVSTNLEAEPGAWGVIINFETVNTKDGASYMVDVLAQCRKVASTTRGSGGAVMRPCDPSEEGCEPAVLSFSPTGLDYLSSLRVHIPKDLRPLENRERVAKTLLEVQKRFPAGVPKLDAEDDMQVDSSMYKKLVRRIETLEGMLRKHAQMKRPDLADSLQLMTQKAQLATEVKRLKAEEKAARSMVLKSELKARRRVLRRLGYIDEDGVVQVKGRVACEISSGDELVLTEMIFNGTFNELTPDEAVALCSCFVWSEKVSTGAKLKEQLARALGVLQDTVRRVGKVAVECKMELDVEEYTNSFRPDLMEVVYAWARGAKFAEVLKLCEVFEGSLIRALRRLEELLRQICAAARSIGETDLEAKFEDGIKRIKRDIVFAASLYL